MKRNGWILGVLLAVVIQQVGYTATLEQMRQSFGLFVDYQKKVSKQELLKVLGKPDKVEPDHFNPTTADSYEYTTGSCNLYFKVDKKTQKVEGRGNSTDHGDKVCKFKEAKLNAEYALNTQKLGPQAAQFIRKYDALELSDMPEASFIQKMGKPTSIKALSQPGGGRQLQYDIGKCHFSFSSDKNQKLNGSSGYSCW